MCLSLVLLQLLFFACEWGLWLQCPLAEGLSTLVRTLGASGES